MQNGFRKNYFSEMPLVSILGITHAIIDMCCAVFVVSLINIYPLKNNEYISMIIIYNVLAFGLQPLVGFVADGFLNAKWYTLLGVGLTCAALFMNLISPWIVVVFAGTGNALFHIGGGITALTVSNRIAPSGWFVAPGALGLASGIYIGKMSVPSLWPYVLMLVIAAITIWIIKFPVKENSFYQKKNDVNTLNFIAGLLLVSVAVRSYVGFQSGGVWKGNAIALWLIPAAIACGKVLGGITADRLGMLKAGSGALVLSFIFLSIFPSSQWCSLCGLVLLQMTMPVTLVALFKIIPGKPGTAFGLCCLALIVGAVPAITSLRFNIRNEMIVATGLIISTIAFYTALKMLEKKQIENTMVEIAANV